MKVLAFFGITLLLVSSVFPLECYKCPRQDSTDQHCLAEGLLLGEVTICSNGENSCESQVIEVTNKTVFKGGCYVTETFGCTTNHKITTCYCENDLCNGPGSSGQTCTSLCLPLLLGFSVLLKLFAVY